MISAAVYSASIIVNNTLTNHRAGFLMTRPSVFKHVGRYFLSADKNRPTFCRPIFLWHTIDFYRPILSADSIGQFLSIVCHGLWLSKVQKPRDIDLHLGSGQGHISMQNACSTSSVPSHLTVASRSTEIWPFEFREISTFRQVWTLMIAFLEGNSNIGLRKAVDQVPYYQYQLSVLSSTRKWRRR